MCAQLMRVPGHLRTGLRPFMLRHETILEWRKFAVQHAIDRVLNLRLAENFDQVMVRDLLPQDLGLLDWVWPFKGREAIVEGTCPSAAVATIYAIEPADPSTSSRLVEVSLGLGDEPIYTLNLRSMWSSWDAYLQAVRAGIPVEKDTIPWPMLFLSELVRLDPLTKVTMRIRQDGDGGRNGIALVGFVAMSRGW